MKLIDLLHHNVRIVYDNGLIIEGYVHMHTSAEDNEPDPESIVYWIDPPCNAMWVPYAQMMDEKRAQKGRFV